MVDTSTLFWQHPIDSIASLFSGVDTSTGNAVQGGDSLAAAQIRAFGIDPAKGKLIDPIYGPSFQGQTGVDPNDSSAVASWMAAVTQKVNSQFQSDKELFASQIGLLPDWFSGSPGSLSLTTIVVLVVVLIVFLILIAKVL
jgi:hypothetical protein